MIDGLDLHLLIRVSHGYRLAVGRDAVEMGDCTFGSDGARFPVVQVDHIHPKSEAGFAGFN